MKLMNWQANLVCHSVGQQQGALLMAAWAQASLATGKRHEHLVPALRIGTPHPCKAEVQVAAAEELARHSGNDGTPVAIAFLVPIAVDFLELGEEPFDEAVERRLARPPWAIQRDGGHRGHGRLRAFSPANLGRWASRETGQGIGY
jgi:hypothetical protein